MNKIQIYLKEFFFVDNFVSRINKIRKSKSKGLKNYWLVPLGFSKILADLTDKRVLRYIDSKLSIYNTFQKRFLKLLLKFKFFKKVKIKKIEGISIFFLSSRLKMINFDSKKIYTFQDKISLNKLKNKYELLNKEINYNIKLKFYGDYIEEDFFFPEEKISNLDIFLFFSFILDLYKKTKKTIGREQYFKILEKNYGVSLNLKNKKNFSKNKQYFSVLCHGDFCKLNFIKYKGKYYVLDIETLGRGCILQDFVRFFLGEYLLSGKINKKLFFDISAQISSKMRISAKEFNEFLKIHLYMLSKTNINSNISFSKKLKKLIMNKK